MKIDTNKNLKRYAVYLTTFVFFMIAVSYASVPLYKIFCAVTGYGGTPKIVEKNTHEINSSTYEVRFDSSVEKNSPLIFEPVLKKVKVNPGESKLIFYKARNSSKESITGMASFNVTPLGAAQYFNKVECFCFEEQVFEPGQEVEMPVSFFINPDILNDNFVKDVQQLTLSYTMFEKNRSIARK